MPAGSKAKEKSPAEPVVKSRVTPFSGFVSFTVAFGILAPDGSETVPDRDAVELIVCAWSFETNVSPMLMVAIKTAKCTRRNLVILPPEIFAVMISLFTCPRSLKDNPEPPIQADCSGEMALSSTRNASLDYSHKKTPLPRETATYCTVLSESTLAICDYLLNAVKGGTVRCIQ